MAPTSAKSIGYPESLVDFESCIFGDSILAGRDMDLWIYDDVIEQARDQLPTSSSTVGGSVEILSSLIYSSPRTRPACFERTFETDSMREQGRVEDATWIQCFKVTVFLREAKSRDPRGSVRGSIILEPEVSRRAK